MFRIVFRRRICRRVESNVFFCVCVWMQIYLIEKYSPFSNSRSTKCQINEQRNETKLSDVWCEWCGNQSTYIDTNITYIPTYRQKTKPFPYIQKSHFVFRIHISNQLLKLQNKLNLFIVPKIAISGKMMKKREKKLCVCVWKTKFNVRYVIQRERKNTKTMSKKKEHH